MSQWVQHKSGKGEAEMKIRHKELRVEFEVRHDKITLLHVGGNFYETVGGSFIAHHDPSWEKVEEWEDVTDRCRIGDSVSLPSDGRGTILFQKDDHVRSDIFHSAQLKDFRLRKIDGPHNSPCFIVERRKA